MKTIRVLDPDLINHIAAGEVVERPASVLKELLENAIDSGTTKITIRVKKGGLDLIEVSDNGSGIAGEDFATVACSHSTSKISELGDLERIDSLGFRGEALASISVVSEMTITSRTEDDKVASEITINNGKRSDITSASREQGTTVSVKHLFRSVPARHKFLKLPQTEYRKLVETFIPHALIHPDIHFLFESEGKVVYNLPNIPAATRGSLHPQRVRELYKSLELIDLFYDGEGTIVGGFVGHPKHQSSKIDTRYIFVNGRPIWDNGIARSVLTGASRFIVEGMKIPFFVALSMPYAVVDVNVHPRKLEVRFANPYRVYSAVEAAVKRAFQDSLREDLLEKGDESVLRLRTHGVVTNVSSDDSTDMMNRQAGDSTYRFGRPTKRDVENSLSFTRMILEDSKIDTTGTQDSVPLMEQSAVSEPLAIKTDEHISARQYLGRYIVAGVHDSLLIVDQHAAAERIRFEKLLKEYDSKGVESQSLMIPVEVKLSDTEALFASEVVKVFQTLGYAYSVQDGIVTITSVPSILQSGDHATLFHDILGELQEFDLPGGTEQKLKEKYRDSVIATMACHSSVRMNQMISEREATQLVRDLFSCENAYSCPHGRPIIWKVTPDQIDEHFNR